MQKLEMNETVWYTLCVCRNKAYSVFCSVLRNVFHKHDFWISYQEQEIQVKT